MLHVLAAATPDLPETLAHRDLLRPLVTTSLEKVSEKRFASARAFREALCALPIERQIELDAGALRAQADAPHAATSERPTRA